MGQGTGLILAGHLEVHRDIQYSLWFRRFLSLSMYPCSSLVIKWVLPIVALYARKRAELRQGREQRQSFPPVGTNSVIRGPTGDLGWQLMLDLC